MEKYVEIDVKYLENGKRYDDGVNYWSRAFDLGWP